MLWRKSGYIETRFLVMMRLPFDALLLFGVTGLPVIVIRPPDQILFPDTLQKVLMTGLMNIITLPLPMEPYVL